MMDIYNLYLINLLIGMVMGVIYSVCYKLYIILAIIIIIIAIILLVIFPTSNFALNLAPFSNWHWLGLLISWLVGFTIGRFSYENKKEK
jgi:hypothetical protein